MPRTRMGLPCVRSQLRAAHDQGIALTATAAQRRSTCTQTATLQLIGDREHEARATGADWMPERNRATVHVDTLLVEFEHSCGVESYGRESLIDLDQIEVVLNWSEELKQRVPTR